MTHLPKITFGMIVLNGLPYLQYNLRALYPFAHQIIIVEGASPAAINIASPTGHSSDGTLDVLRDFQKNEDPEKKLIVVTAEDEGLPNGFWPGEKDQQSQAYAKRASGDYLWQVDVDEFYHPEDMQRVVEILNEKPEITAVSFNMLTFWGGFEYIVDGWYLRRGANQYHRLFKWGDGYQYTSHRPPTVVNAEGEDLRDLAWLTGTKMSNMGIHLYHYSLVFPSQVKEKSEYYTQAQWAKRDRSNKWYLETYLNLGRPFRVHNVYQQPSWLERYNQTHPYQIEELKKAISSGREKIIMRSSEDIDSMIKSPKYKLVRILLKVVSPFYIIGFRIKKSLNDRVRNN